MIILDIKANTMGYDRNTVLGGINETLATGSYCEPLYHALKLTVTAKCEDNNDYVLRLMHSAYWNSCGIHMHTVTARNDADTFEFKMSLMTAINFIYEATPPLLQSKIKESIISIDNIVEILKTYVIEDNGDKQLRLGLFLKHNGLYDFKSPWTDNNGKTKTIRNLVDINNRHPMIAYMDIQTGDFVQYVISTPLNLIKHIEPLIFYSMELTHVCVEQTSLTQPSIVNIKCHNVEGGSQALDLVCKETLDLCEKILNCK